MLNLLDLDEFIIESKSKKTFVEKGYYFNDIIQNLININDMNIFINSGAICRL